MDYKSRVQYFEKTLSANEDDMIFDDPIIDMEQFRLQCFYGIPDVPGIRQKAWKLLLDYLPPDKREWSEFLTKQRTLYYNFVRDLLEEPDPDMVERGADHPLNSAPDSKWVVYFADNAILEQIDKDVRRTLPDFAFFQLPVPISPLSPLSPRVRQQDIPAISSSTSSRATALEVLTNVIAGRPRSASQVSNRSAKGNSRRSSWSSAKSYGSDGGENKQQNGPTISSPRSFAKILSSKIGSSSSLAVPQRTSSFLGHSDQSSNSPCVVPIPNRRSLFKRIAHLNKDFGAREHQPVKNPSKKEFKQKRNRKTNSLLVPNNLSLLEPEPESVDEQVDLHWEAIERLLFIYAKLNPGVGYVQGMNELLGPIYYLFANDRSDPEAQAHAEADAFFTFTNLMASVRDHFVRTLDADSHQGIGATLAKLGERLRWVDEPLWRNIVVEKEIKEQYYAFRWITVLGTQEWAMPEAIRLWDSVLGDPEREEITNSFEFLIDFFVAMVICVREELLNGDFAENMKLLQNYPISDISIILSKAYKIREFRLAAAINSTRNNQNPETASIASSSSVSSTGSPGPMLEFPRASWDTLRKDSLDQIFGGLRNSARLSRFGRYRSRPQPQQGGVAGDLFGVSVVSPRTSISSGDGGIMSRRSSISSSVASSGSTTDWLFKRRFMRDSDTTSAGNTFGAFLSRPTINGTSGVAERVSGWVKKGQNTLKEENETLRSPYTGVV